MALGLMSFAGNEAAAQVVVKVKPARPAVVVKRPAAKAGYVWIAGHWKWNAKAKEYRWVKAHWIKARAGHNWTPGKWVKVGNRHKWVPGAWHAHGHKPGPGPKAKAKAKAHHHKKKHH